MGHTNHDPAVIAEYYLKCACKVGGFPQIVTTDSGTENVTVASFQAAIFGNLRAHKYGNSPGNQRIEGWWSFFWQSRSQWWIDLFENFVNSDIFHPGNVNEIETLRYCNCNCNVEFVKRAKILLTVKTVTKALVRMFSDHLAIQICFQF